MLSGTVPTMIYYGLLLLAPSVFYPAACLLCAVVAVSIGSSWTVAGTIGVALIGVAGAMDLSIAITAGAVISGAYFGDKMSPLSDTTNLAPAVTGIDIFTHIRHMAWTTGHRSCSPCWRSPDRPVSARGGRGGQPAVDPGSAGGELHHRRLDAAAGRRGGLPGRTEGAGRGGDTGRVPASAS
jgi:hypothetical protein